MAIIKCKMCGGDIELSADKSFGVCEFCGSTMTLPKVDDDQRAAAFNRGNHFRRIGEFDKALTVYEALVRDDEADAEAHWCCALCRFGIEYVKDPASGEYMPTCHRASFDSFLEDVDTKAAIEHADAVAKRQYERDAQIIEEVRRGILTLSQNEQPYDVFICYKETDDRGQRTIDSQRAQEIYYQLTDQGRRVFFARITLEDKAGQQYEPYIFAALNSAKVMIVVGTRREHLEAVWVKNEWSRFLAIMKRDRKKLLIPCYADMDPYDMPEQLSVLQSYDMTKIGFIQDLTRGIAKVLDADKKPTQEPSAQEPSMSGNVKALLKRGNMALEDGDWAKADEFFEQVLNQNAECAEAYMGKALAENKAFGLEYLLLISKKSNPYEKDKEDYFITTDKQRAKEAIERWVIPNYLAPDKIRKNYEFRESCKSEVKYWTQAKEEKKDWWESERNIARAIKYAAGTIKQDLENWYKEVMEYYDEKIRDATTRFENDKAALEQKFAQFNDDADKKSAELYASALESREQDYTNACKAQAEAVRQYVCSQQEKAEQARNMQDLTDISKRFVLLGDYKDSAARSDSCLKIINEIKANERKLEAQRMMDITKREKRKKLVIKIIVGIIVIAVIGALILQWRQAIAKEEQERIAQKQALEAEREAEEKRRKEEEEECAKVASNLVGKTFNVSYTTSSDPYSTLTCDCSSEYNLTISFYSSTKCRITGDHYETYGYGYDVPSSMQGRTIHNDISLDVEYSVFEVINSISRTHIKIKWTKSITLDTYIDISSSYVPGGKINCSMSKN